MERTIKKWKIQIWTKKSQIIGKISEKKWTGINIELKNWSIKWCVKIGRFGKRTKEVVKISGNNLRKHFAR